MWFLAGVVVGAVGMIVILVVFGSCMLSIRKDRDFYNIN